MAKEVGKIYRVKKQVQGVVPSTQNDEYFEPLDLISMPTDTQSSSEAVANNVIIRDNVGSAKVKMPSSVVDDTIVNKSYLKASNIILTDGFDNVESSLQAVRNSIESINILIEDLRKRLTIPPYYIQFANASGVFESLEEPSNWFDRQYIVETTWELMFNTESVYFRTEGSLANSGRSSGKQGDAGRNATGIFGGGSGDGRGLFYRGTQSGVFFNDGTLERYMVASGESVNDRYRSVGMELSRQWTTASEFRTVNRLIRVYRLLTVNGESVR